MEKPAHTFQYSLSQHVYVCRRGNCYVLLDLPHDRYISIDEGEAAHLSQLVSGWPPPAPRTGAFAPSPHILQELATEGLITEGQSDNGNMPLAVLPAVTRSLIGHSGPPLSPVRKQHIPRFAAALVVARVNLKYRTAAYIASRKRSWSKQRNYKPPPSESEIRDWVGAFNSISNSMLTKHDNCLESSFVLAEFLSHYSFFPTCVIGIRTVPFAAHCWLQHADLVINESAEYAKSLTPILVV